jgi:predicted DNA-binding transcriptional regulator AlpA
VNLHIPEALTSSAATAIAEILERAAADIRARVGSSRIRLDDLGHDGAHDDVLLDPPALAALLKIDERTLRRLRAGHEIPEPVMLGVRKPRWRKHDIDAWLAERSEP